MNVADIEALSNALSEELKGSKEARYIHRLHCVLLVGQGYSSSEVAKSINGDRRTVARWVRHYKEFGILGLRDDRISGRPAKLDQDQLKALEQEIGKAPMALGYSEEHWDGKLLAAHLQEHYGVTLSVRQCQRLLRQLHDPIEAQPTQDGKNALS